VLPQGNRAMPIAEAVHFGLKFANDIL